MMLFFMLIYSRVILFHKTSYITENVLYRRSNIKQLWGCYTNPERQLHGIALSEIVTFIEQNSFENGINSVPLFKLSDLVKLYVEIIKNLKLNYLVEYTVLV